MNVQRQIDGNKPGVEKLKLLGDLLYLYFRSPKHQDLPLRGIRAALQPPIDLQQVVVFHHDDVPVASITWAFFSEQAEQAFLTGRPVEPSDWRSGTRMWVVEMVSLLPDGRGNRAIRWFLDKIPDRIGQLQFLRNAGDPRATRRVVFERNQNGRWGIGATIDQTQTGDH